MTNGGRRHDGPPPRQAWDPWGAEFEEILERLKRSPEFVALTHEAANALALEEFGRTDGETVVVPEDVRGFAKRLVADVLTVAFQARAPQRAIDELGDLMRERQDRKNHEERGGWWTGLSHLFAQQYPGGFPPDVRKQVGFVVSFLHVNYPELRTRLQRLSPERLDGAAYELQSVAALQSAPGRRLSAWTMAQRVAEALGLHMPKESRVTRKR
jgi:hypothetical protein